MRKSPKTILIVLMSITVTLSVGYLMLNYIMRPNPPKIYIEHRKEFHYLACRALDNNWNVLTSDGYKKIPSRFIVSADIVAFDTEPLGESTAVWFMIRDVPCIVHWFIYYDEDNKVGTEVAGGKVSYCERLDKNWFFVVTN